MFDCMSCHVMQVVAYDGGSPRRSSTLLVVIDVADVNDNAPSFDRDVYHVTVPEDAEIGRTLIRVAARDPDLGDAGRVRYQLQSGRSSPSASPFRVDPDTGREKFGR
jgi:hypothetical protein